MFETHMKTRAGFTLPFRPLAASAHAFLTLQQWRAGRPLKEGSSVRGAGGKFQHAFSRQSHTAYLTNSCHTISFAIFTLVYFS